MRIIFSPDSIQGTSLLNLMKSLTELECGGKILDSMVYDNRFVSVLLRVFSLSYPNLNFIANSFVQIDTILNLQEYVDVYIYTSDYEDKYRTGNVYVSIYKQLKRQGMKNLHLDEDVEIDNSVTTDELLKITLIVWRNMNMGEITDAIAKALGNVKEDVVNDTEDKIKQAMADIGMPVENYKKSEKTTDNKKKEDKQQPKESNKSTKKSDFMNPPVESVEDEPDEICCKVSNGKLLIMIPKGTKLNSVTVGDNEFDTITIPVPDITHSRLQVMTVIDDSPKSQAKEEIVRVPIFLDKKETEPQKKKEHKNEEKTEVSDGLESLKDKKAELDEAIKQARKSGDEDLVNELRKQRRKLRNEMNKLS